MAYILVRVSEDYWCGEYRIHWKLFS